MASEDIRLELLIQTLPQNFDRQTVILGKSHSLRVPWHPVSFIYAGNKTRLTDIRTTFFL